MIRIMRIFAQMIDILMYFIILIACFILLLPFLEKYFHVPTIALFVLVNLIYFLMQIPFYANNQTLGKAFFGLHIVFEDNSKKMSTIFIREIFIKLMTLYIVCTPVFFGNKGLHETMTHSKIIVKKGF